MRKREAIAAMKEARQTHVLWAKLSAEDLAYKGTRAEIGGDPAFHERWVRIYDATLQYLATKKPAPVKCIVKICPNHSDEGTFVGPLCAPCAEALRGNRSPASARRIYTSLVRTYDHHGFLRWEGAD